MKKGQPDDQAALKVVQAYSSSLPVCFCLSPHGLRRSPPIGIGGLSLRVQAYVVAESTLLGRAVFAADAALQVGLWCG